MVPFVARPPGTPPAISAQRVDRGVDYGPLESVMSEPDVTDVFVNGPRRMWVDRGDGLVRHPFTLDEPELRELATRLVWAGGRHIDEASPTVDARLPGGVRVHAVLPPISPAGTLLSIRVPSPHPLRLADLEARGFFGEMALERVRALVAARVNLLITGASGSGNTTRHI